MKINMKTVFAAVTLSTVVTTFYIMSNHFDIHSSISFLSKPTETASQQYHSFSDTDHGETKEQRGEMYSEKGQLETRNFFEKQSSMALDTKIVASPSAMQADEFSKHRISKKLTETDSADGVKVWLSKQSRTGEEATNTGSKLLTESSTKSKDVDTSCYPRLFAMVSSSGSARCDHVSGKARGTRSQPVQHLFFLKTHKTGSQTLTSVFNRYALVHNLTVAIRKQLHGHAAAQLTNWIPAIRPLPPGLSHYDMITDHVRFDEDSVRHFLPKDAVFVTAVREPLDRFVSAFYYYRDVWHDRFLIQIPGPDPLLTYLFNMKRWDGPFGTFTHGKTAYDLGLDSRSQWNNNYIQTSLKYLSRIFHLVLLTEAFDESIVLLKRTLSWNLQDVLYVKFNVGTTRQFHNFTRQQKVNFEKHRRGEYAIYRHFRFIFYQKVAAEGETFAEEVKVFKSIRSKVESFCHEITNSSNIELRVEDTKFNERFRVSVDDCDLLKRESSSVKDIWFEQLMIKRLNERSHQQA